MAHYHIRQKDLYPAISGIRGGYFSNQLKKEKSRYLFMVAQMHYNQENYQEATNYFSKVIRISPDYEMTFNAKINIAVLLTLHQGVGSN